MLKGQVGDSRRTVRSLSAASKPRITQRTTRYTPSIQVEGARQIFLRKRFKHNLTYVLLIQTCSENENDTDNAGQIEPLAIPPPPPLVHL